MYIYEDDYIVNVNVKIDSKKLEKIIDDLKNKMNNYSGYKQIYIRFISLIEEIQKFNYIHNDISLLENLSDYKSHDRYYNNAVIYLNKKLNQYSLINDDQMEEIIRKLPHTIFVGLYGEIFQDELANITDCFKIENCSSFKIDVHTKILNLMEGSNKEALSKWKNMYFTSIKNSNIIKLLNIKNKNTKVLIKNKED